MSQKSTFCGIPCKSREKRKAAKMTYYKTAVKCKVAVALCTRVRTTVVFSKQISKKRFSSEHVCKVSSLKCRISILSRLLQYFLKVLQNRSEKLNNLFSRAFCARLIGKNSDFRTAHTTFTTKLRREAQKCIFEDILCKISWKK